MKTGKGTKKKILLITIICAIGMILSGEIGLLSIMFIFQAIGFFLCVLLICRCMTE